MGQTIAGTTRTEKNVRGITGMTELRFQELAFTMGLTTGRIDVEILGSDHTFLIAVHPLDFDRVYGAADLTSTPSEYGLRYYMGSTFLSLGSSEGQNRMFTSLGY